MRTTKSFIEECERVHGSRYDYSKVVYRTNKDKVTIGCPAHGAFQQRASSHLGGSGCSTCAREARKQSTDEFIALAKAVHGDRYDYSQVVYGRNQKDPVKIICPEHGVFEQIPNGHLNGGGCAVCGAKLVDMVEFQRRAKLVHGDRYDYSRVNLESVSKKVTVICPEHGPFKVQPRSHMGGTKCSKCAHRDAKLDSERLKQRVDEIFKGSLMLKDDHGYKNYREPFTVHCAEHGPFQCTPASLFRNRNKSICPRCANSVSINEQKIFDYLSDLGVGLLQRDRKIVRPYELDIVSTQRKVAIEYNGDFWHSDRYKKPNFHQKKTQRCEDAGYRLIHVFEYMFQDRERQVLEMLRAKFGVFDRRIAARKCEVREITQSESKAFVDENHLQGNCRSSVRLGLFDPDDALVAVMTFSRPRFSDKQQWELVRFCSKMGAQVMGGAGKLLRAFERQHRPDSLCSYANRAWSDGGLYLNLGFSLSHKTRPNYIWNKNYHSLPRYKTQKHKLQKLLGADNFSPEKSEIENMHQNGYRRIFDAGNLVFTKFYGNNN